MRGPSVQGARGAAGPGRRWPGPRGPARPPRKPDRALPPFRPLAL